MKLKYSNVLQQMFAYEIFFCIASKLFLNLLHALESILIGKTKIEDVHSQFKIYYIKTHSVTYLQLLEMWNALTFVRCVLVNSTKTITNQITHSLKKHCLSFLHVVPSQERAQARPD
jgi:hypothetical protein